MRFHQAIQNDNLGINGGKQRPHVTTHNKQPVLCTSVHLRSSHQVGVGFLSPIFTSGHNMVYVESQDCIYLCFIYDRSVIFLLLVIVVK